MLSNESDFNSMGFLGNDVQTIRSEMEKTYRWLFEPACEINSYCEKLKYQFNVQESNKPHFIILMLTVRILDLCQSTILMSSYKNTMSAGGLMRSIVETYIQLISSIMNRSVENSDILSSYKDALKYINLAKYTKMQSEYDVYYRTFSKYTHTSTQSINEYFDISTNGSTVEKISRLNFKEHILIMILESVIRILQDSFLKSAECFNIKFNEIENIKETYSKFKNKFAKHIQNNEN